MHLSLNFQSVRPTPELIDPGELAIFSLIESNTKISETFLAPTAGLISFAANTEKKMTDLFLIEE